MVRNSVRFVAWEDYKAVTANLKRIYQSVTEEEALLALDQFAARWDEKYPQIGWPWRAHWDNICTLFKYPEDIKKAIYTTNAIESLYDRIRRTTDCVCLIQTVTQLNLQSRRMRNDYISVFLDSRPDPMFCYIGMTA